MVKNIRNLMTCDLIWRVDIQYCINLKFQAIVADGKCYEDLFMKIYIE